MITADTITRDQLLELRHSTGWIGERCERDQQLIGNALRGDPVARGLCAGIYNERIRAAGRVGA